MKANNNQGLSRIFGAFSVQKPKQKSKCIILGNALGLCTILNAAKIFAARVNQAFALTKRTSEPLPSCWAFLNETETSLPSQPFQDPDPFHEVCFANGIKARRAIADSLGKPLALLVQAQKDWSAFASSHRCRLKPVKR